MSEDDSEDDRIQALRAAAQRMRDNADEMFRNIERLGLTEDDPLSKLLLCLHDHTSIMADAMEKWGLLQHAVMTENRSDFAAMMKQFSGMIEKAKESTLTRDEYMDKAIRLYEHRLKAMYIPAEDFRERVFEEFQRVFRERSEALREELSRGFKLYRWSARRINEWKWVAGGAVGMFLTLFMGRLFGFAL